MKTLFDQTSQKLSQTLTQRYSTSFSLGIRMLHRSIQPSIYSIYGFVRLGDEIVDSFHDYDKAALLEQFQRETFQAIESGISINPILNAFQLTVNKYQIDHKLIYQFIHSMEMDLHPGLYSRKKYEEYILGSAEVVGLMCLTVFCQGDKDKYERLKGGAMHLGAAFQKVNFLRDIRADQEHLGRVYFPNWNDSHFSPQIKEDIEAEIHANFAKARQSISKLPKEAKFGVYSAYVYYKALFLKIRNLPPNTLFKRRIRISNGLKLILLLLAKMNIKLNRV